jgi:Multicopper oxidase
VYDAATHVPTYNLVDPLLQDTVTLWPGQWVAIRFVANNPGVWFFHCHIMAHERMGMALHIVTQPDEVKIRDSLCPNSLFDRTYPLLSFVRDAWSRYTTFLRGLWPF